MRFMLMALLVLSASCGHKRADEVEPAKFAKVLYSGTADGAQLTATALPGLRSPATGGPWGWLCVPLFFLCLPRWNVQVQLTAQTPGPSEPLAVVNLYDSEYTREFGSVISELSVVSCHDPARGKHLFRVERTGPNRDSQWRLWHRVFTLDGTAFAWGTAADESCAKQLAEMPTSRAALDDFHRVLPNQACDLAQPVPKLAKQYCP